MAHGRRQMPLYSAKRAAELPRRLYTFPLKSYAAQAIHSLIQRCRFTKWTPNFMWLALFLHAVSLAAYALRLAAANASVGAVETTANVAATATATMHIRFFIVTSLAERLLFRKQYPCFGT